MSNPRPIHRELNDEADEAEPSFSYEQESFLMGREEDVEDEFHRRLNSTRRDAGGSFWRTSGSSGELAGPSFSSMSMKQRQDSTASLSEKKSTARPGVSFPVQCSPVMTDSVGVSPAASVSFQCIEFMR